MSCALPRQCAAGLQRDGSSRRFREQTLCGAPHLHRAGEELERVRLGDRPSLTLTDSRNTNRRPLAARRALEVPAPGGRSAHWRSVSWAGDRPLGVGRKHAEPNRCPFPRCRRGAVCSAFDSPEKARPISPPCATRGHASCEAVCHWGRSPPPDPLQMMLVPGSMYYCLPSLCCDLDHCYLLPSSHRHARQLLGTRMHQIGVPRGARPWPGVQGWRPTPPPAA